MRKPPPRRSGGGKKKSLERAERFEATERPERPDRPQARPEHRDKPRSARPDTRQDSRPETFPGKPRPPRETRVEKPARQPAELAPRQAAPASLSDFGEADFQRIYGKHPVREALTAGRAVYKIWLAQNLTPAVVREFEQLAREHNVPVQQVPHQKLNQLLEHVENPNHQGIVAEIGAYDYADWDAWLKGLAAAKEAGTDPFVIVLDQIQDPHNLGAIIRTAEAAGVQGVVIPKHGSVGLSETVAKASAGAIETVPVLQVTNLARALEELKAAGLWIMGLSANQGESHFKANLKGPIALVIGNENKGLRPNSEKQCDHLLIIPMASTRSLNASVAAAVAMYEVVRQRQA